MFGHLRCCKYLNNVIEEEPRQQHQNRIVAEKAADHVATVLVQNF
jgi:hypothetical protein